VSAVLLAVLSDAPAPIAGSVRVELGLRLVNWTNIRHAHAWAQRARSVRRQRASLAEGLQGHAPPPGPWVVRLHRVAWSAYDTDGAVTAAKTLRDGIAAWLGLDDRSPRIRWELSQSTVRQREPYRDRHGVTRLRTVARVRIEVATDPTASTSPAVEARGAL
jgi:hypothetical protein